MSSTGISTIDMMGMPGPIRRIIRIMLRKSTLSYDGILEQVNKLPEEKRPSEKEVKEALDALVSMEWLHSYEEDGETIYSVKMAKKVGSEESRSGTRQQPNQSSTMGDLWGALDEGAEAAGGGTQAQKEMSKMQAEQRQKAAGTKEEADSVVEALDSVDKDGIDELQNMAAAKTSEIKKITKEQLEEAKEKEAASDDEDTTQAASGTKSSPRSVGEQKKRLKEEPPEPDEKPGFFKRLFGGGKKK
jgi:hypothetical protein